MKNTQYKYSFKKAFVSIFYICTISFICNAEDSDSSKQYFKTREEREDFLKKVHQEYYSFCIEGTIIDPEGKIITDVTVNLTKTRAPMLDAYERKSETIKNGKFSFSTSGCYSWGLNFSKKDFYPKTSGMGSSELEKYLSTGEAVMHENKISRKVTIVLAPHGNLNKEMFEIDRNGSSLSWKAEGTKQKVEGIVIPYLDKDGNPRKDESFQFAFQDEKELPDNLIYIVPGRKADGSSDGTIRVKTNCKNGGFIPLAYQKGIHFFRSMHNAPETDYLPEIKIEDGLTNYLQHNYVTPKKHGGLTQPHVPVRMIPKEVPFTVFYFKINDYYGKGLIMPSAFPNSNLEKDKASLAVYLFVNSKANIRNTNICMDINW